MLLDLYREKNGQDKLAELENILKRDSEDPRKPKLGKKKKSARVGLPMPDFVRILNKVTGISL